MKIMGKGAIFHSSDIQKRLFDLSLGPIFSSILLNRKIKLIDKKIFNQVNYL